MKKIILTAVLIILVNLKFVFAQDWGISPLPSQTWDISPHIVCIDSSNIKEKDGKPDIPASVSEAARNIPNGSFIVALTGKGATSTAGGCSFQGPAQDNLIWVDYFYKKNDGTFLWSNADDIGNVTSSTQIKLSKCTITGLTELLQGGVGYFMSCTFLKNSESIKSGGEFKPDQSTIQEIEENLRRLAAISRSLSDRVRSGDYQPPSIVVQAVPTDPCERYNIFDAILGVISGDQRPLACIIAKVGLTVASLIIEFVSFLVKNLMKGMVYLLMQFERAFNTVLGAILSLVVNLNPFSSSGGEAPGIIIWRTLRDISYIILIFSALYAGFIWLFEGKGSAFSLIFNIIIVAYLINFSYAIIKLLFEIGWQIENGIVGGTKDKIYDTIHGSLWQANFLGNWEEILNQNQTYKISEEAPDDSGLSSLGVLEGGYLNYYLSQITQSIIKKVLDLAGEIAVVLMPLLIEMVVSGVLMSLIILFVKRFIEILKLTIISPLAFVSIAFPRKGLVSQVLPQFPFELSKWFSDVVKWVSIIPIFLFFVILGISFQQTFVNIGRDKNVPISEYLFVFIFLLNWFILSFSIANSVSDGLQKIAGQAAFFPSWLLMKAMGRLWGVSPLPMAIGKTVNKVGDWIEKKMGNWPILGWQLRSLGKSLQEAGRKVQETSYFIKNKQRVMEDIKQAWKDFSKNPDDDKAAGRFYKLIHDYGKQPAMEEDIKNFLNGLGRQETALIISRATQTRRDILDVDAINKVLNEKTGNFVKYLTTKRDDQAQRIRNLVDFLNSTDNYVLGNLMYQMAARGGDDGNQFIQELFNPDIRSNPAYVEKIIRAYFFAYNLASSEGKLEMLGPIYDRLQENRELISKVIGNRRDLLGDFEFILQNRNPRQQQGGGQQGGGQQGGGQQGGGQQGGGQQGGGQILRPQERRGRTERATTEIPIQIGGNEIVVGVPVGFSRGEIEDFAKELEAQLRNRNIDINNILDDELRNIISNISDEVVFVRRNPPRQQQRRQQRRQT